MIGGLNFLLAGLFQIVRRHLRAVLLTLSGFLNEAKEWAGELLSGQNKVNIHLYQYGQSINQGFLSLQLL